MKILVLLAIKNKQVDGIIIFIELPGCKPKHLLRVSVILRKHLKKIKV